MRMAISGGVQKSASLPGWNPDDEGGSVDDILNRRAEYDNQVP